MQRWRQSVPLDRTHPGRALQERYVKMVRVLLLALLAVLALIIGLPFLFLGPGALSPSGLFLLLGMGVLVAVALALLRSGWLGESVGLVVLAALLVLATETAEAGVVGSSTFLFAYTVPIAFAGLLLGRAALLATALASVAIIAGVHLAERVGVPWVAVDPEPGDASTIVIVFTLVIALLALVLERFGVELLAAHRTALGRQHALEREIEERKLAERERESLLESERMAREAAETSGAKLSFLAEASHLLASSLDPDETLRQLTELLVPRWADWCTVDLLDDQGRPRRLSVAHRDPQKLKQARELQEVYAQQPGFPGSASAIREGEVQYLAEISDDDLASAAQDEGHLRLLREVGLASLVSVPLVVRGKTLGAVTLVNSDPERHFTPEDVLFFQQVAGRAAVAVEQSRLFDEVRSLNQDLEQRVEQRTKELSEALAELEAFAYSVSHDLRAPLRGIDGFSQAMMEDYADDLDTEAVQYLERIRSGARRMGELIDDLLKLSRLSQGALSVEEVDLSQLVRQVVAALQAREPERDLAVQVQPGLVTRGDRRLLRIALENLIGNAWKFTREVDGGRVEVGVVDREGEAVYYVRDNGIGFDMNYYDKLFVPFQRLHSPNRFEGSGIGLATVQRVLRRHGGRIWAEGEPGAGATFYFTVGE